MPGATSQLKNSRWPQGLFDLIRIKSGLYSIPSGTAETNKLSFLSLSIVKLVKLPVISIAKPDHEEDGEDEEKE